MTVNPLTGAPMTTPAPRVSADPPLSVHKSITQWGQVLNTRRESFNPSPGFATVAKDCVRWKADDESAIMPVRIYLGPWQPQVSLQAVAPGIQYAQPIPWTNNSNPTRFDQFSEGALYAQVMFGAGGVQHTAYVDWPRRGLLFQVGASYVQINGVGTIGTVNTPDALPILAASMSLEPGGGDSPQSGTFTYPRQEALEVGHTDRLAFQVPPFARAFQPIFNYNSGAGANPATIQIEVSNDDMQWRFDMTQPNTFPQSMVFPIPGNQTGISTDVVIRAPGIAGDLFAGCMFYLDL
jgi:hypothetical protein